MLILLEGLPGTGKSTNSRVLLTHFERNGRSARWFHEEARPHPTLFFYEASLSHDEYSAFVRAYPNATELLERIKIVRDSTVGIDLLEVKWNRESPLEPEPYQSLCKYDVWNFPLNKYVSTALEKWRHFAAEAKRHPEQAILLDSSIFQFQIYTFLLENAPDQRLLEFVRKLFEIIEPLNPSLLYFYREITQDSIDHVVRTRGESFLQRIWERDRHLPYYQSRPAGPAAYREFLLDYGRIAENLFHTAGCRKLGVEVSDGNWAQHESELLDFFELKRIPDPVFHTVCGVYRNEEIDAALEIREAPEGLFVIDPAGKKKRLFPKSETACYIEDIPTVLRFVEHKIVVEPEQICDRWTTTGTEFHLQIAN